LGLQAFGDLGQPLGQSRQGDGVLGVRHGPAEDGGGVLRGRPGVSSSILRTTPLVLGSLSKAGASYGGDIEPHRRPLLVVFSLSRSPRWAYRETTSRLE